MKHVARTSIVSFWKRDAFSKNTAIILVKERKVMEIMKPCTMSAHKKQNQMQKKRPLLKPKSAK